MEKRRINNTLTLHNRLAMSFEEWLTRIEGVNGEIVQRIMAMPELRALIDTAPGSRGAHQAFKGGYAEHIRQTMLIASHLYELTVETQLFDQLPSDEHFTESDALLVMFLHDIEKPFLFGIDSAGDIVSQQHLTKAERTRFRADFIERFKFQLTENHLNALQYVEGVRDTDYVPGSRADKPLAALCHAADNVSARGYYNYQSTSTRRPR